MSAIKITGLVKDYGSVRAVDAIDLEISKGEFVVLLGPSGCGKTTTLRSIAGLEQIDGGQILIGGDVVSAPNLTVPTEERQIGMVFQSYAIWPHLTVFENVAMPLKLKNKGTKATIAEKVEATLQLVGLAGYGKRGAHQLSGGQLQRVALARAIVAEPRVLLFDEPLSNLDAALRERMRFELRALQQKLGITSVYVTHDQQEAMAVADRIVLMHNGRIEQIGKPRQIYDTPASLFAAEFIGNANIFPGQVTAVDCKTSSIALAGGIEVQSESTAFGEGKAVNVVIRPERIRQSETRLEGPNVLRGKVRSAVFLGSLSDVLLTVGDLAFRLLPSPPVDWATGAEVWIQIPRRDVVILPSERQDAEAETPLLQKMAV